MPALTFDDLTTPGGVPVGESGRPRVTIDTSTPKAAALDFSDLIPETTAGKALRVAKDVGMGVVSGLDKGVAQLAGLPADAALGINAAINYGKAKVQGRPFGEVEAESDKNALISRDTIREWGGAAAHKNSPLHYDPKTQAGETAKNVTEFIPGSLVGPGSIVRNLLMYGVAPGAVAEAAGNIPGVKGSAAEPFVRAGAALATGGGAAIASSGGTTGKVLQRATEGVSPEHLDQAENLFSYAQSIGMPITRAEAIQHVTEGGTALGNVQRVVEGTGAMRPMLAERAGQVEAGAREAFDAVAPAAASPSAIGADVRTAARSAVDDSPEGRVLAESVFQAGPRTSPADAGAVIQPELQAVRDRREGMRAALADQDYTAAREAPATIPTNGGHRVADVTTHHLDRPDIPIIIDPVERAAARARWLDENNSTAPTPIVGERPTQFAQVDAAPVVAHIDDALDTAKGAVKQGLTAARRALMDADGNIDTTVAGLHNSRKAIDDLIGQAKLAGANQTVSELMDAKATLDRALEAVPAYGQASRNFRAASDPLAPFGADRVPGRIVERNQYNDRFEMTPDQVAGAIERGGRSAAQEFNQVAPPAAREAFEGHLITQTLEKARGSQGDLSADSIRKSLRQNEDVIGEFPSVRARLEGIASARDALERVLATPIGKLADKDITTKRAIDALFPNNPLPSSADEVGKAVGALSQRNPNSARQLVRAHIESVFNEAAQRLQSGANEFGGAKFAAVLRGNPQQAENLEAAVRALPKGDAIWDGFERFLNVVEAQGQRQRIGSNTSFNNEMLTELKRGGATGEALPVIAGGGIKFPQKVSDAFARWRLGKNIDELAYLLADPNAGRRFRELIDAPQGGAKAAQTAGRLALLAQEGARTSKDK